LPEHRVTAIRFQLDLHEALQETAEELGVSMNWLVNRLCREGLDHMTLTELGFTSDA